MVVETSKQNSQAVLPVAEEGDQEAAAAVDVDTEAEE